MDKLKALRDFMAAEGLAALLIPRTDEFLGEYISPSSDRFNWLTGFTGSAGFVVVTKDKAAFFTDGRYTLQAKEEVPSLYKIYNTAQKTPSAWVKENLSSNEKVGYDPLLFTEAGLLHYDRPLIPLKSNPIDALWKDRPNPPLDYIFIHPLQYAGESSKSKRKRITEDLDADNVLITACDSIAWLLNIRGHDVPFNPIVQSVCLLHKDGSYDLFVDLGKISEEILNYIRLGSGRAIALDQLQDHLKTLKGSCGVDPKTTPIILIQTLEAAGVKVIRERDPCVLPKALKNEVELEGAFAAHIQDGLAHCRFLAWLEAQPLQGETTEISASEKFYEFRKLGENFKDLSFTTISAYGPHGAIIHYHPTPESDVPLAREGIYLVDSGGQYLTGTTDVTRTVALGNPTPEQKEMYTRVLKGYISLGSAIFPERTSGNELDILARQYLWQVGCDYEHGTGHGVGSYLNVHEGPQGISRRAAAFPLMPTMIISNEPGYYKEGEYGIRIESIIGVVEVPHLEGYYGFETLTLVPFDLQLIDTAMLTDSEKVYINKYHEQILNTLIPLLDSETKAWLEKATQRV